MKNSTINLIINILILIVLVAIVVLSMGSSYDSEKFSQEDVCKIQGGLTSGDKVCQLKFSVLPLKCNSDKSCSNIGSYARELKLSGVSELLKKTNIKQDASKTYSVLNISSQNSN
jgi:hypothetical protein